MLFQPPAVAGLNSLIAPCGARAAPAIAAEIAPGGLDAAVVRIPRASLALKPLAISAAPSRVSVLGYGVVVPNEGPALNNMRVYNSTKLSDSTCTSISSALQSPGQWLCLGNDNSTICHGDSGGAVVSTGSRPTLVALNVEGTYSPAGEECAFSSVSLHLLTASIAGFVNAAVKSWGDVLVPPTAPPAVPPSPPPVRYTPVRTGGAVVLRGVHSGTKLSLWCGGVSIATGMVVTSAGCLGNDTDVVLYSDPRCVDATGTRMFNMLGCQNGVVSGRVVSTHPSWAPYSLSFGANASRPASAGVDLAIVRICGSWTPPVAQIAASIPAWGVFGDNFGTFFPAADCASITHAYNRPDLACLPMSKTMLTGTPVFGPAGAVGISTLTFLGTGTSGARTSMQVGGELPFFYFTCGNMITGSASPCSRL